MSLHKLLLSVPETCAALGICKASLYGLIKQKKLKPFKIGRRTFFTPDELTRFTTEHTR